MLANRRAEAVGRELLDRATVEELALDRGALDDATLVVVQAVQASREERPDRTRHGHGLEVDRGGPATVFVDEEPVVDHHRQHLFDEERIAFGRVGDSRLESLHKLGLANDVRDKLSALVRGERLQQGRGRVELPTSPLRSDVEELGPCHANEEHRSASRPVGDVFDTVEEDRLAPVDVVEHNDERSPTPEGFEEAHDRGEGVLDRSRRFLEPDRLEDVLREDGGLVVTREERDDAGPTLDEGLRFVEIRDVLDGLEDRPERDSLPVRQASTARHECLLADVGEELLDETRLADAGSPEDREQLT